MFFTLDRIEESRFAVLTDDTGRVYSEELSLLPEDSTVGDVFVSENGKYVHAPEETAERQQRLKEKKNNFFNKLKKKQEEI